MFPGQQGWFFALPHAHSHPFTLLASQSPKPSEHVVNAQAPAAHVTSVAFRLSQLAMHEPQ
jgi:hypothetical protein